MLVGISKKFFKAPFPNNFFPCESWLMPTLPSELLRTLATEVADLQRQLAASDEALTRWAGIFEEFRQASLARRELAARLQGRLDTLAQMLIDSPPVNLEVAEDLDPGPPAESESDAESSDPVAREGVEIPPMAPLPPPVPTEQDLIADLRQRFPQFDEQMKIFELVKTLHVATSQQLPTQGTRLKECLGKLHEDTNALLKKLRRGDDPKPAFHVCGNDCMISLRQLTEVLVQLRPRAGWGALTKGERQVHELLQHLLAKLWEQVQGCLPGEYEQIPLTTEKSLLAQRPDQVESGWYEALRQSQPGTVPNQLIEIIAPGYVRIRPDGQKSVVVKAQVVLTPG
jgi:hypothetical protein